MIIGLQVFIAARRRTEVMGDSAWPIGRFPCDESNQPAVRSAQRC
jgi:hypothetical protein